MRQPVLAVELLRFEPESGRTTALFAALMAAAPRMGVQIRRTSTYDGTRPLLMLWGPGAPERSTEMRKHVARGGHAIAWDLAYWDRDRKARVSIDAAHPSAWVMQQARPKDRLVRDQIQTRHAWKSHGQVIMAGIGEKARIQYGADTISAWERQMLTACKDRWPERRILYRKKTVGAPAPDGVTIAPMIPIEQALTGASLVITWHSNVAVDAIRLGIPVICRDGAAAAICPPDFGQDDPTPVPDDVREQFLRNLAYFQWAPNEAAAAWQFLREVVQ